MHPAGPRSVLGVCKNDQRSEYLETIFSRWNPRPAVAGTIPNQLRLNGRAWPNTVRATPFGLRYRRPALGFDTSARTEDGDDLVLKRTALGPGPHLAGTACSASLNLSVALPGDGDPGFQRDGIGGASHAPVGRHRVQELGHLCGHEPLTEAAHGITGVPACPQCRRIPVRTCASGRLPFNCRSIPSLSKLRNSITASKWP